MGMMQSVSAARLIARIIDATSPIASASPVSWMSEYTYLDLDAAYDRWQIEEGRLSAYAGHNPNKFRSGLRIARITFGRIEDALKVDGALPVSDIELARLSLNAMLEALFPMADNLAIVEHDGLNYQKTYRVKRGFVPAGQSGFDLIWRIV